jgi:hypothetical protein
MSTERKRRRRDRLRSVGTGFVWLSADDFTNHFAADLEPTRAKVMYAVQQPLAATICVHEVDSDIPAHRTLEAPRGAAGTGARDSEDRVTRARANVSVGRCGHADCSHAGDADRPSRVR